MEKVDVGKYIVIDPEICHGQMTFRGTRVPVDTVLVYLAKGYSVENSCLAGHSYLGRRYRRLCILHRSHCKRNMLPNWRSRQL